MILELLENQDIRTTYIKRNTHQRRLSRSVQRCDDGKEGVELRKKVCNP